MSVRARRPRCPLRWLACLTLLQLPAAATAQPRTPEDRKAFTAYRLTMPTVRTVLEALHQAATDAEAKQYATALEGKQLGELSVAELAKEFDRIPPMKRAIAKTGLSGAAFVTALYSFLQAAEVIATEDAVKKMGATPEAILPTYIPKENVELIRQNKAEIERLSLRLAEAAKSS